MASTSALKVVDFTPEYALSGDFKKVSEYDFLLFNTKIAPVMAIIFMDKGSNQLVPDMGARDMLLEIPFTEQNEVYSIVQNVQDHVIEYTGISTRIYVDESNTDWSSGDVYICVEISGIPNPISVEVQRSGTDVSTFKVVNPSVFM